MDPFILVLKHSCLNMNLYGIEDVAILKCTSKDIKKELESLYTNEQRKQNLLVASAINMGFNSTKPIQNKTALNRDVYIRYMIELSKYYKPEVMSCEVAHNNLLSFLEAFTLHNSVKAFTKFQKLTIEEQVNTMDELLGFTSDNKNKASKILAIYLIYYFISKLYKHNGSLYAKNKRLCILSSTNLRFTIVSKGTAVVSQCKEESTMFPYKFIDKVIRLIQETNRNIKNL